MGKFVLGSLLLSLSLMTACSKKPQLEACTFIEVETPEAEVTVGDVDIEGGEVEMLCGERLVDVPWSEFKKHLKIDPKAFVGDVDGLKKQVGCLKDANSKAKQVSCSKPSQSGEYASLKFNYDD
ncbi:MAG: hypothetical protein HC799_08475 [Limnothrix sp. RL_2_0]|nr:hypothetical protein [Limnothrix sp. RL_2_0]